MARAPADGAALLLGTSSIMAASPNLGTKLPYNPLQDFALMSMVATIESVLVVHPSVPANNGARADRLRQGQPRQAVLCLVGCRQHLSPRRRLFASLPYKGAAPAIQDVLAGQVNLMFDNVSSAIPNIQAGRLRALGVASLKRYPDGTRWSRMPASSRNEAKVDAVHANALSVVPKATPGIAAMA